MRALFTATMILIGVSVSLACKFVVPKFGAVATNGRHYSTRALIGKPTIIVFLKLNCPGNPAAVPDFNRLAASLKGKVQILGVINCNLATAKTYAKKLNIGFPLIPDAGKSLIKGFGVKRSLEMTSVASKSGEARFPKIWDGYSRVLLQEVLDGIEHHGYKMPKLDLSRMPTRKRAGCSL